MNEIQCPTCGSPPAVVEELGLAVWCRCRGCGGWFIVEEDGSREARPDQMTIGGEVVVEGEGTF